MWRHCFGCRTVPCLWLMKRKSLARRLYYYKLCLLPGKRNRANWTCHSHNECSDNFLKCKKCVHTVFFRLLMSPSPKVFPLTPRIQCCSCLGDLRYAQPHAHQTDPRLELGMRTRIFYLAPAVNEAASARALLTAREATNLGARRKLDFLRMTEVDIPKE